MPKISEYFKVAQLLLSLIACQCACLLSVCVTVSARHLFILFIYLFIYFVYYVSWFWKVSKKTQIKLDGQRKEVDCGRRLWMTKRGTDVAVYMKPGTSAGFWLGGQCPLAAWGEEIFENLTTKLCILKFIWINNYLVSIAPFCTPACFACSQNIP